MVNVENLEHKEISKENIPWHKISRNPTIQK